MNDNLKLVKEAYRAWESKDIETLSKLLHKDYVAKMPGGMQIVGIEGAKECLAMCPFTCTSTNETYLVDGDKVMRIWDNLHGGPATFTMRMAELTIVKDGKIFANEAFFDSAAFPPEVQEGFKAEMEKQKLNQNKDEKKEQKAAAAH